MTLHMIVATLGAVGALALSLLGEALALGIYGTPAFEDAGIQAVTLTPATSVAFAIVGWVVIRALPTNQIGWLMLATGMGFGAGMAGGAAQAWNAAHAQVLPGTVPLEWLGLAAWYLMLGVLWPRLLILFPDGHLPSPRWRIVNALQVLVALLTLVVILGYPAGPDMDPGVGVPALRGPASVVNDLGYPLVVALILAGAVATVVRFRRARGLERAQLKWIVWVVAMITLGLAASAFLDLLSADLGAAVGTLTFTGFLLLPIAIGIAVMRYRLYEIDRIIRRTIGWAIVTGILVAVFAVAVLALQLVLAGVTQGETLAVAASTLVAFALFQPLRRRVQAAVDRRFDRARYDGQRAVDAFAEELRDRVDLLAIRRGAVATVDQTVRPKHVAVWLRSDTGS